MFKNPVTITTLLLFSWPKISRRTSFRWRSSLMPIFIPSHVFFFHSAKTKTHRRTLKPTRPSLGGLFVFVSSFVWTRRVDLVTHRAHVSPLLWALRRSAKALMFHLAICSLFLGILRENKGLLTADLMIEPCVCNWGGQLKEYSSFCGLGSQFWHYLKWGRQAASCVCRVSQGSTAAGNLSASQNTPAQNLSLNPKESHCDI